MCSLRCHLTSLSSLRRPVLNPRLHFHFCTAVGNYIFHRLYIPSSLQRSEVFTLINCIIGEGATEKLIKMFGDLRINVPRCTKVFAIYQNVTIVNAREAGVSASAIAMLMDVDSRSIRRRCAKLLPSTGSADETLSKQALGSDGQNRRPKS